MPISYNTALFSLVGTTYGGDGKTTFALPNLCGRTAVGANDQTGLYRGDMFGQESVTLIATEMPQHTHVVRASGQAGTVASPDRAYPAAANGQSLYGPASTDVMNPMALSMAGGSQPHDNMMPYTGLNYIICLRGMFPYRP
jgi:microcystin-dependent protein